MRVEMRRPILMSLPLSILFSSALVTSSGAFFGAVSVSITNPGTGADVSSTVGTESAVRYR